MTVQEQRNQLEEWMRKAKEKTGNPGKEEKPSNPGKDKGEMLEFIKSIFNCK